MKGEEEHIEIIRAFLDKGISISPEALEKMVGHEYQRYIEGIKKLDKEITVLLPEHLDAIEKMEAEPRAVDIPPSRKPRAAEYEPEIEVEEVAEVEVVEGSVDDFARYFESRYERISQLFSEALQRRAKSIDEAKIKKRGDPVLVIGMIRRKWESRDRRTLMMLVEDHTGSITCFLPPELRRKGERLTPDQVVAIKGIANGKGAMRVDSVLQPDVPASHEPNRARIGLKAVLISDTHIGSRYFNKTAFKRFLDWLKGEKASLVKYLVIAGDLIDGIGIYPDQEKELEATDISGQFGLASQLLSEIPDHVTIIYIPGNHEPVRQAEPQPAVSESYAAPLTSIGKDIRLHGNPTTLRIHGVRFLLYHGRGLNAVFKHVPGLQPISPETVPSAMIELLRARSLVPIYGEVPVAPQSFDHLVIHQVPDVFHAGHIHVCGNEVYRGIKIVNSGTFQDQTPYLRGMDIKPTTGTAVLIDLRTLEVKLEYFI